eukprot:RCo029163
MRRLATKRSFSYARFGKRLTSSAVATPPSPLTVSYVKGDSSPPLLQDTLYGHFEGSARRYTSQKVLSSVHQQVSWSWDDLKYAVDRFSAGLQALGYQKGDRLAVLLPNCVQWVVIQLATARLGVILVNINTAAQKNELLDLVSVTAPRGVVLPIGYKTTNYVQMMSELAPSLLSSGQVPSNLNVKEFPSLKQVFCFPDGAAKFPFTMALDSVYSNSAELKDKPLLSSKEVINIQYSGTQGIPLPAALTHVGLLNNGYFSGERLKLTPHDVLCIPVPLFHCFGMVSGNLSALTHGSHIVYPSEGFDVTAVLQAIHTFECTTLLGVPTMFHECLKHPKLSDFNISRLRTGIMSGAPCPEPLMREVMTRLNIPEVTIAYGMTETSPMSWQTLPSDTVARRTQTVGTILPHVECKIV